MDSRFTRHSDMASDQLATLMKKLDVGDASNNAGVMEASLSTVHVPDEVLSTILAFLPLVDVLRCRVVGKRWNSLSLAPLFRDTYARVSGQLSHQYINLLEKSSTFAHSQVVSSVGGLLVLATDERGFQQTLYVVNPTHATVKRLPDMLHLHEDFEPGRGRRLNSLWSGQLERNSGGSQPSILTNTETVKNLDVGEGGSSQQNFHFGEMVNKSEYGLQGNVQDNSKFLAEKPKSRRLALVWGQNNYSVVGMVENSLECGSGYKILAAQEGARPVTFQVYDSIQNKWKWTAPWRVRSWKSWETPGSFLSFIQQEDVERDHPISFHLLHVALHQGSLHCLAVAGARFFSILRLDEGSLVWQVLPGLFPPSPPTFVCDFRCRPVLFESTSGHLMVAAAQVTGPTLISVNVWRYSEDAAQWVQVASTHQLLEDEESDLCRSSSYAESTFFYLDASGVHLCLGAFPNFRNPEPKVLLFSLLDDSWSLSRLPELEVEKKTVSWQKRAFLYDPTRTRTTQTTTQTTTTAAPPGQTRTSDQPP